MAAITTAELATALDTDPRTVRKFLRSEAGKNSKVGKGARWSIEKREVAALRKRFARWSADNSPKVDEAPVEDATPIEDEALEATDEG